MKEKDVRRHSLRAKMMGINIGITLASFLLCGALFVLSVSLLVGKYVNHDMDFFLTEMSDNLNTKMAYLESVIYEIRDSDQLMAYLEQPAQTATEEHEHLARLFSKAADINDEVNQGKGSKPIVDKIYLFDKKGQYTATYYYALADSQIQSGNRAFEQIYAEKSEEYECRDLDGKTYISYPILNDNMDLVGTVIYELDTEVIENFMRDVKAYKNAFWVLSDESKTIAGEDETGIFEKINAKEDEVHYEPYPIKAGASTYRVYQKALAVNLQVMIGIPENQAVLVLFDSVKIYVLGILIILCGGLLGFVIFTYKMTKPIQEVTGKMKRVQEGDFETKLPDYDSIEFHEISMVFNEMTEYINHLVNEVYEKQISIKEMELKFLQTQMNPHFMFNVLNAIALQARLDQNEELFRMISSFSQLIQAKIYRNNEDKVRIRQELEYIEYYLYLQSFRYEERLKYQINIRDREILDMYIPKLCMQLIVENAVVHGIEPQMEAGLVVILLEIKSSSVYIEITDNGVGFKEDGEILLPIETKDENNLHNHIGLNNAHHIIQLMYGEQYGIRIFSNHGKGTKVSICIPFDEGTKEGNDAV